MNVLLENGNIPDKNINYQLDRFRDKEQMKDCEPEFVADIIEFLEYIRAIPEDEINKRDED